MKQIINTPWGIADRAEVLADGIISYGTPSHGGIRLSLARQASIPDGTKNWLGGKEWWEEDCDWAVPYVLFADDITAHGTAYKHESNLQMARAIVERHYPELHGK